MADAIIEELKDMRNDEAYDAFDKEVHDECTTLGMGIFIV